jgi:hypothetical protein
MATIKTGHDEGKEDAGAEDNYYLAASAISSIAGPNESEMKRFDKFAREAAGMIIELAGDQLESSSDLLESEGTVAGEQVTDCLEPQTAGSAQRLLKRYPWIAGG